MEIYLIRHTSVDVPAGYAYGQTDVALRPSFEEEAAVVKANLQGITFDQVYCSPLSRCTRLAAYCNYPDAIREERIKELNFGEWEMKSWDELSADPRSAAWFADWINAPTPQGESFLLMYQRISSFLHDLQTSGLARVCLFAHGGVLTCARVFSGAYPLSDAFKNIPSYGEIIRITL
ncbi:MAG: alpha-ribazole phosphatase [Tannerellaceae bacterium]